VKEPFELIGLTGGYAHAPIIHDVSLSVGSNEIVGLLGANGAGKTTVLRAVSGELPICGGQLRLDGVHFERMTPWARAKAGVAHVPEGRHVFGAMTVRENLDVAGLIRRRSVPRDFIFELFPRLAERQKQVAGSLSGGEQQMLAIARALMTAPRVLMIDEMSSGLAPIVV
jgi:branched-chain amino acid transport system ATP-binding protein